MTTGFQRRSMCEVHIGFEKYKWDRVGTLQDDERLAQSGKLIRPHLGSLVPQLRLSSFLSSEMPATTQHSFGGSFSAGSTPIFASKYAFCSIFRNLQENHLLASKFGKFLLKNRRILQKKKRHVFANLNFAKFCKIFRNPPNFCNNLQNFLQNFTEICRY